MLDKIWLLAFTITIFLSNVGYTSDQYYKSDPIWVSSFIIEPGINVRSVKPLTKSQIKIIKRTYFAMKKKFFNSWTSVSSETCAVDKLEIRLINSHNELDNREYFPNEDTYADKPGKGNGVIFGRYFWYSGVIYLVPVDMSLYFWKDNFIHELMHYYFDKCDVKIHGNEHTVINRFLNKLIP